MKKILVCTLLAITCCISGCSVADKTYPISTYITKEMNVSDETGLSTILLEHEYTPTYMKTIATDVAIVTILSLDHADMNFSSFTASTYGSLLINNVIDGSLEEGQVKEYVRPGGIVTVEEFERTDFPEAIEKRDYLREQQGITLDKTKTYYDLRLGGDITIEAGKTYLAYLGYHENHDRYEIIGLENGLREINVAQADEEVTFQSYDLQNLQIKNNTTHAFESLEDYLQTYFPKK